MAETAAQRFERKWGEVEQDRRDRGLNAQSTERKQRLFVAPDGSTPADDETFDPEA